MKEGKTGKKKINKALIVVNIIALLVIIAIVSYFVFFKDKGREGMASGGPGMNGKDFADMDIDDICENFEEMESGGRPENFNPNDSNREPPEGFNQGNAKREMPEDMDREDMRQELSDRKDLINEICEDGEVSDEEREKFEEMKNSVSATE